MKHIKSKFEKTSITRLPDCIGESIELEIRKAVATNQPIEANADLTYTPHKDGVLPQFNPRTDTQDLALEARTKYEASQLAANDWNDAPEETKNEETEEQQNIE